LLARVGAMYHDIGKTQKPDYFVENQEAQMSRHDRLSPTMSLLIITGHVKDGLEMARAYGLPRVLHQFILEHHGTTIVKYFHHAASEAAAKTATGKHDREVAESEFRYPGPKPRIPESAILMLCDGCEGAVRAITEPTPGRIESTVHQVVMARLIDGQFDNCDITLKDLRTIEQSIVKSLCAIHHGRIKYPTKDAAKKSKLDTPERAAGKPALPAEAAATMPVNGSAPQAVASPTPATAAGSMPAPAVAREPAPEVARQA
jgi:cyclic-di-AMP phosphodiesterase PgpH